MSQTEVRLVRQLSHRAYPLDGLRPRCDFCLASFGTVWTNKTAQQKPRKASDDARRNASHERNSSTHEEGKYCVYLLCKNFPYCVYLLCENLSYVLSFLVCVSVILPFVMPAGRSYSP